MKHDPIDPENLAEQVVVNGLNQWLADRGKRAKPKTASTPPLLPPIRIPANPTIGVLERSFGSLRTKALANPAVIRFWLDRHADSSIDSLKSFYSLLPKSNSPIVYSCSGNSEGISHRIIHHPQKTKRLTHTLAGVLPSSEYLVENPLTFSRVIDAQSKSQCYYAVSEAPSPFWSPITIGDNGLQSLFHALASLNKNDFAVFQLLILPITENRLKALQMMARIESVTAARRLENDQWTLSPEASQTWRDAETAPTFCVSPRLALFTKSRSYRQEFESLKVIFSGISASNQPLNIIGPAELRKKGFSSDQLRSSLTHGFNLEMGLLFNSEMLTRLSPLPTLETIQSYPELFDIKPRWKALKPCPKGPFLLSENRYRKERSIRWPQNLRSQHMLVSGVSGKGKSTFLASLATELSVLSEGLAIIDPHDTTIDTFLRCIPDNRLEDCILHDPTDSDYIFCLPLLDCNDPDQIDLATSNVTHQICSLFAKTDLGFNIVQGIKNVVRTILLSPELSLLDMQRLLDKSMSGSELREKICAQLDDEILINYWTIDFESLDRGSIGRIRSRFEHLLESRLLRPLLGNKLRKTSYTDIIAENKIFLAKTCPTKAGADLASILGTLHSTGFQSAGLTRTVGQKEIFTVIADEFGNYSNPRNVSHALRTLRKFGMCLVLATQNIQALPAEVIQATSNIGTHIAFQQGWDDAQHYYKAFAGQISNEELLTQKVGEGFAKIGDQLAEIKARMPTTVRDMTILKDIRQATRDRYCVHRDDLLEQVSDEEKVPIEDLKNLDLI